MKGNMNGSRRRLAIVAAIGIAAVLMAQGSAPGALARMSPNPGVIPPNSHPYGRTYGDWGGAFWQWLYSIPVPNNPALDETGVNCGVGQAGPVWYLPGVFNVSGSATRGCTIPSGKALFFPILNAECSDIEGNGTTEDALRACARSLIDPVTDLAVEVDGVPVQNLQNYRVTSSLMPFTVPDNNLLQLFGFPAVPGEVYHLVSDGYYLMLSPLPVGQHTLHFHGSVPDIFTLDITYDPLTVTAAPGP
jgi:hypothetical protein